MSRRCALTPPRVPRGLDAGGGVRPRRLPPALGASTRRHGPHRGSPSGWTAALASLAPLSPVPWGAARHLLERVGAADKASPLAGLSERRETTALVRARRRSAVRQALALLAVSGPTYDPLDFITEWRHAAPGSTTRRSSRTSS